MTIDFICKRNIDLELSNYCHTLLTPLINNPMATTLHSNNVTLYGQQRSSILC